MTRHLDRQLLFRFSLRLSKFLDCHKQKETCVSCLEYPTARCPDYAELSRNLRLYLQTLTPLSGNVPSTCTTAERSYSKSGLEAIQKTAAVIPAAIQLPTAETDERTYAEAHESMEAPHRNQQNSSPHRIPRSNSKPSLNRIQAHSQLCLWQQLPSPYVAERITKSCSTSLVNRSPVHSRLRF
jgi:hypothetical protein